MVFADVAVAEHATDHRDVVAPGLGDVRLARECLIDVIEGAEIKSARKRKSRN
jgi:hypothetical protein